MPIYNKLVRDLIPNIIEETGGKVAALIKKMPMTKWSGSSKGLIGFEEGIFALLFDIDEKDKKVVYEFTKGICVYRLQGYFERKK